MILRYTDYGEFNGYLEKSEEGAANELEWRIRQKLDDHFSSLGISEEKMGGGAAILGATKDKHCIRSLYSAFRQERLKKSEHFIKRNYESLLSFFCERGRSESNKDFAAVGNCKGRN
jgi:hypothetical protein